MSRIIKTTFQLRRGLAQDWTLENPLLMAGEPGFEIDTNKLKIGTGLARWNDLEYLTANAAEKTSIDAILDLIEGGMIAPCTDESGHIMYDSSNTIYVE